MLGALLVYNVQYLAAGGTAHMYCVQYLLVAVLVVLCIAKYVMLYWQTIKFPCK